MMRAGVLRAGFLLGLLSDAGCTFYTACPDQPPANPPSNPGGGSGGGGSSGTGGSDVSQGGEPPAGEWQNETYNLVDLQSECGNLAFISSKPGEDRIIAGVALNGLWSKTVSDTEWTKLGQADGSGDVIVHRPSSIVYDPNDPDVYWESGIYNGPGVFRTDDNGETFQTLGTISSNDAVSVDLSDPDRLTLLATGHEQGRKLYHSEDGGMNWVELNEQLHEDVITCSYPLVMDASTFLLGCGTYGGGKPGIYRSTDTGESWEALTDLGGGAAPLVASDGAIYWASESGRGLMRSDDSGLSWVGPFGGGEVQAATPIELPDGRIAALGNHRVVVSEDKGEHWVVVSPVTPIDPVAITYSEVGRTFYIRRFTCEDDVPRDGILAYAWDYETQ